MTTVNYETHNIGVARQIRDELTNHRENCRAAEALTVERDLLRYAISAYRENADDAEAIARIAYPEVCA